MKTLKWILDVIAYAALFILVVILLGNIARAQPFETLEEANAHYNACMHTDWQVRHYQYNPCAINLNVMNYGLYLFGHKSSLIVYNAYTDALGENYHADSLENATKLWQMCAARLDASQANADACEVTTEQVQDLLDITENEEVIRFVSLRSFLAQALRWEDNYIPPQEPAPTPTPVPPPGPECTRTQDMVDGPGGSLWKPVSEGNGRPVVLMPRDYCQYEIMEVWGTNLIERAPQTDCSENGPRGHWRLSKRCSQYPDDLLLRFGTDCRTVPESCEKYD
jgi:hypothetical protein